MQLAVQHGASVIPPANTHTGPSCPRALHRIEDLDSVQHPSSRQISPSLSSVQPYSRCLVISLAVEITTSHINQLSTASSHINLAVEFSAAVVAPSLQHWWSLGPTQSSKVKYTNAVEHPARSTSAPRVIRHCLTSVRASLRSCIAGFHPLLRTHSTASI